MISKSDLFRQHHFLELLHTFDPAKGPIDLFVSNYFRHNPQLGSKDRLFIVERVYKYFRWKNLVDALLQRGDTSIFDLLEEDLSKKSDESLPIFVQLGFPENLFHAFERSFGDTVAQVCRACNEPAPITIRVNISKITKTALKERLKAKGIECEEVEGVESALTLAKRVQLVSLEEFKEGLFEMQDAGSQKVAELLEVHPGDLVLDFCAGAAGKTLGFAYRLENKGQVFLYDIREKALLEAKKRLRRAGIQNAQCIFPEEKEKLQRLHRRMDWVLLDVPCSGTGTLRRNPDMKWKFSEKMLQELIEEQRRILKTGVSFVKPGGILVYATCSILREENENQVAWVQENFGFKQVGEAFSSLPTKEMDGFFAVKLRV